MHPFYFIFIFSHTACGSYFSDQGANSCPLHWRHGVLKHWTAREVPKYTHFNYTVLCFKKSVYTHEGFP